MDTTTFITLVAACAPLVHTSTALAIATTESSLNPHAIGVVGGRLERQPRNIREALSTAQALQAAGRNFSVGLAQINVHNLKRLDLTLEEAFNPCKNLGAMQAVLSECYGRAPAGPRAQQALREALSCYYSGNYTTGFRHGYVNRVAQNARRIARAPP
jgi:type IV secretion system protein VirB1